MSNFGFEILERPLRDVFVIRTPDFRDQRGTFRKCYHSDFFSSLPTPFKPAEHFFSTSSKNVLRGMHFQRGKCAHQKLVSCMSGSVLDVIVDVREDSPEFNKPFSLALKEEDPISILIGKGYAHGFLSLCDGSIVQYFTSTVYSPCDDKGVLWSSINYRWPVNSPILSLRDRDHPAIGSEKCTFS